MTEDDVDPATRRQREVVRRAIEPFQPSALVGLSESAARARVEGAGGIFRAHAPDDALTMDFRSNRVTAEVVDGRVTQASVG